MTAYYRGERMTDPLLGCISNHSGSLQITDNPGASPNEPTIRLSLGDSTMELNLADLSKVAFTLRQAQDLLANRKAQAFLDKNLSLF